MMIPTLGKWVAVVVVATGVGYGATILLDSQSRSSTAPPQIRAMAPDPTPSDTGPTQFAATLLDNARAAQTKPVAAETTDTAITESTPQQPLTEAPPTANPAGTIAGAHKPDSMDQKAAAADLLAATENVDKSLQLGPITACFDQMRAFACPIVGSVPIVKDIVGRVSMELGISCPTVYSPSAI